MVALDDSSVTVYTVNGAASGSSSSLPDWLTRKRAAKKGQRAVKERVEGTIDLIQEFEFPEASNKVKTTRDGHHAIATGVYKPQMRVYDLDQLTLKFERHSDAENVDFIILSDDWTKTLHLQADRSVELHTQGGFHYRTRIPRFGRAIGYHFPSCDALVGASGPEVYRLNLEQGRFLNPLVLEGEGGEEIIGVNAIDINAAHQLFAFGADGNGTVEFWDPRSRSRVGLLRLPSSIASAAAELSVTAIASRSDGLSYAIGTSTGHTLLYDIRSARPFASKDLGYGLPVKTVSWIEGGSRMAGDGMILSADKKVIKIWDRNNASGNFASITPAYDINHVHHLPGSGLLMLANEGIQMTNYYIPQLGPAPRWCSFLDNITEEMEDQTVRNVYEDYKFVERADLAKLGLDHLVGTAALKPYMHGYFLSLRLYDAARMIANPFAYAEHREKVIKDKLDKQSESRIRTRKDANAPKVKVNKALAERLKKEEDRAQRRAEKKERKAAPAPAVEETADADATEDKGKPSLFNDPRFSALFEDPAFEIDEESREFALLNPSAAAQKKGKGKTAVEEEEEESDRPSSDEFRDKSSEDDSDEDDKSEDSSDAGDLDQFNPRARPPREQERAPVQRRPAKQLRMVAAVPQAEGSRARPSQSRDATFGQRRRVSSSSNQQPRRASADSRRPRDGAAEISWVPTAGSSSSARHASDVVDADDMLVPGGRGRPKKDAKRRGVETFGAGMERGGEQGGRALSENERQGRTGRRSGIRSGSKNVFRRM